MPDREPRLISAVHLATKKLSNAASVEETLRDVLELCVEAADAFGGTIYIHDAATNRLLFRHVLPESVRQRLPVGDIPNNFGIAGQVFQTRRAVVTRGEDLDRAEREDRAYIEEATDVYVSSMLTAPLAAADMQPIGVVQLINKRHGEFDRKDLEVIETVCAVSAMAYMNSTLTEQASRAAGLMGMGRVSHDIGNLAAALHSNLMYLDPLVEKLLARDGASPEVNQEDEIISAGLDDLKESIERIVGYSRLISDIAAGRAVRPSKKAGSFAKAVAEAASYLESEARRNGVALRYDIEQGGAESLFDPQFVLRIVQNLVGNAIKAVRESLPEELRDKLPQDEDGLICGEVCVRCVREGDRNVIEVKDSGAGMPDEVIRRILSGTAMSHWSSSGGSGWGTKIVLELAAALGGSIDIESAPGQGTVFRVFLPAEAPSDKAEANV